MVDGARTSRWRWILYGAASGIVVMGPLAVVTLLVDHVVFDRDEDLGLAVSVMLAGLVAAFCGGIGGAFAGFLTAMLLRSRRMREAASASQYAQTAAFVAALSVTLAVLDLLVEGDGVPAVLYLYMWILPAAAAAAALVARTIWREQQPPPDLMADLPPPGEGLQVGREAG